MYEILVELLVATALVDKSYPPCWRTNELLGAIERLIMVTRGQCAEFAQIASAALDKLGEQGDPAVRVLLKLAELNGRRRCDNEDTVAVQRLFDEVRDDIAKLEDGPRKQRCWTFYLYQHQVFGARCGYYAEASQSAKESAKVGDLTSSGIALWHSKVYAMWAAVMTGSQKEIEGAFSDLKSELPNLQKAVAGTVLEVQWGKGNGPIHLLQGMVLANVQDKSLWHSNMETVLSYRNEFGDAFKPCIGVLLAERSLRNGDTLGALVDANRYVIENPVASMADKTWARLILARAQSKLNPDGAIKDYQQITAVPDAHMVAAVAARELASLTSK